MSDVPTVSNIRQDLTKWQEIHAKLVLSTVKVRNGVASVPCPPLLRIICCVFIRVLLGEGLNFFIGMSSSSVLILLLDSIS